jgi:uncharacterized protein (TIGR02996 family)
MHDEDDFLRALLANPADDAARMVYADWLDERGDDESRAKAQFLRVTVRLMGPIQRPGWRAARRRELHDLAQTLPAAWLAVVSRPRVESCPAAKAKAAERENVTEQELWERYGIRFNVVCDRRWDELTATADPKVRHCDGCQKDVHYCDTVDEAKYRAWAGGCVAVSLGVTRAYGDLEQREGIVVGGSGII